MPQVLFSEGQIARPTDIDQHFELMLLHSHVVTQTGSTASLALNVANGLHIVTMALHGTGLEFGPDGLSRTVTGGTLDAMTITFAPGRSVEYSRLGFDIATLTMAAGAELANASSLALERLLYPLDWIYIGNSTSESYTPRDANAEGNPVTLSGNNVVVLKGGADLFHGGKGKDSMQGGEGNDTLYGGAGNDTLNGNAQSDHLFGSAGDDKLLGEGHHDFLAGGAGRDSLVGGWGQDTLSGGEGRDVLDGGRGNDHLVGGADRDTFVLRDHGETEWDRIADFEPGLDAIHIHTTAPLSISENTAGVRIVFGSNTLMLSGIGITDLTVDDITLF